MSMSNWAKDKKDVVEERPTTEGVELLRKQRERSDTLFRRVVLEAAAEANNNHGDEVHIDDAAYGWLALTLDQIYTTMQDTEAEPEFAGGKHAADVALYRRKLWVKFIRTVLEDDELAEGIEKLKEIINGKDS